MTGKAPRKILVIIGISLALCMAILACTQKNEPAGAHKTTNHSAHEILQQDFASVHEVTRACLSCHSNAAAEIQQTIHWTWLQPNNPEKDKGKAGLTFNNFCISLSSNEPRCTSCHIGYGWKSDNFDFDAEENVDCLVCHDLSGNYKKFPSGAGYPAFTPTEFEGVLYNPPDYKLIFSSIGLPGRDNCGTCHFFGGGGDAVKHGDLDSSLSNPSRDLDVHMSPDGANLTCRDCHATTGHVITGRGYAVSKDGKPAIEPVKCSNCHGESPHSEGHAANDHYARVSCQACHIPSYARKIPTKMSWDWSVSGKLRNGKAYVEKNEDGNVVYDSKKGAFTWQRDVQPEYFWYDGTSEQIKFTDTVDASKPVAIKKMKGSQSDPASRLMPFKPHTGKQPYDPKLKRFLAPHLFGNDKTAYWGNYNWEKAIEIGQQALNLPWSGEYVFVETVYYHPVTHMVAPKENALDCTDCHKDTGRLKGLAD